MANEGIMAMPQGMGMQGEQAQQEQPTVTSADSYDAAQTALGMSDPGAQEAIKAAIRESLVDEQLSPQELQTFIVTFELHGQGHWVTCNHDTILQINSSIIARVIQCRHHCV